MLGKEGNFPVGQYICFLGKKKKGKQAPAQLIEGNGYVTHCSIFVHFFSTVTPHKTNIFPHILDNAQWKRLGLVNQAKRVSIKQNICAGLRHCSTSMPALFSAEFHNHSPLLTMASVKIFPLYCNCVVQNEQNLRRFSFRWVLRCPAGIDRRFYYVTQLASSSYWYRSDATQDQFILKLLFEYEAMTMSSVTGQPQKHATTSYKTAKYIVRTLLISDY